MLIKASRCNLLIKIYYQRSWNGVSSVRGASAVEGEVSPAHLSGEESSPHLPIRTGLLLANIQAGVLHRTVVLRIRAVQFHYSGAMCSFRTYRVPVTYRTLRCDIVDLYC